MIQSLTEEIQNPLKYDFAEQRKMPDDVLPLWVADMDFQTSSYVQDALKNLAEHGIFGYSEVKDDYFVLVRNWMQQHYDWEVHKEWLIKTPGIVFALALAVKAYTKPGGWSTDSAAGILSLFRSDRK